MQFAGDGNAGVLRIVGQIVAVEERAEGILGFGITQYWGEDFRSRGAGGGQP